MGSGTLIANLRGQRLRVVPLEGPSSASEPLVGGGAGRLRGVSLAPGGFR